jgi:hypothetical protein
VVRNRHRLSLAVWVAAVVLGLGWVPPAQAATAKQLDVVLVTQLTSWSAFPDTETWTGSGIDTEGRTWTFTETVTRDHWFLNGTFSMQSGADVVSGTVRKSPTYVPFVPLTYEIEDWSYAVTDGAGAYEGCTGPGSPVRQRVTPPLVPPSGVVVSEISFTLSCP